MSRPKAMPHHRPRADGAPQPRRGGPPRDADFGFTAGVWPQGPDREAGSWDEGCGRPFRRDPQRLQAGRQRQYGEYDDGLPGRFGAGEDSGGAGQWDHEVHRGGTPGFAESGRPGGEPWSWRTPPQGNHAEHDFWRDPRAHGQDPAYGQRFEGRLPPQAFDDRAGGSYGQGYGHPADGNGGMGGYAQRRTSPRGYTRSDERIRDDVCERLCRSSGIDVEDVSVEVKEGCVCLEGTVPHRSMKYRIEDLVESAIGVKDIDNRIRVARGDGASGGMTGHVPFTGKNKDQEQGRGR